jgi:hypothetical protein
MESHWRRALEWVGRYRVLILAVWITIALGIIILITGCRDTGDNRPEPSPGPAIETPNE